MTENSKKNLLNLIHTGGDNTGPRIYAYKSITVALYRAMPKFEQSLIMKLLSANTVELANLVASNPESKELFEIAEEKLIKNYGIVEKFTQELNGPLLYKLNKNFELSLKDFLVNGMEVIFEVNPSTMSKCITQADKFEEKLKNYAYGGWSNLYRNMLEGYMGRYHEDIELTENLKGTLESANLSLKLAKSHTDGFDFLLDSVKNQVSSLLYSYCSYLFKIKYKYMKDSNGKEAVTEGSILNLLLNLTLLVPVMGFSVKKSIPNFFKKQIPEKLVQDILRDMDCLGLIRAKKNEQGYVTHFAATPLIHNVLTGTTALQQEFKNNIVVEPDFKIYAYSVNNEFLHALLNLFTVIKVKFPGLLVCSIKEEKVKMAYRRGITPDQILRYLNSNAHFKVVEKKMKTMTQDDIDNIDKIHSFVPENIYRQLFIWHLDSHN